MHRYLRVGITVRMAAIKALVCICPCMHMCPCVCCMHVLVVRIYLYAYVCVCVCVACCRDVTSKWCTGWNVSSQASLTSTQLVCTDFDVGPKTISL